MDFKTFPVNSTNIFPIANSTAGGQLVTEYNLRSRESVCTPSAVNYMIGPSFVHSMQDYAVSLQTDGSSDNTNISTSVLQVAPGRGVFNGHFVESLAPMIVDMADANAIAATNGETALVGDLCIGIRIMYSTEATVAGTMKVENEGMVYEGVQLVILPKSLFKLPIDVPNEPDRVTAHLKLADFVYANGTISGLTNNPDKIKCMDAERINGMDDMMSGDYLSVAGLDPNMLYTLSGRGASTDYTGKKDTWCNSVDSLMIWDADAKLSPKQGLLHNTATFDTDSITGKTFLYVPHKQPNSPIKDTTGTELYYPPAQLDLPLADFNKGTPGTVDSKYTKQIKNIASSITNLYHLPNGKQLMYISELDSREVQDLSEENQHVLPTIQDEWAAGDYILVGIDNTEVSVEGDRSPSTLYTVLPGKVLRITGSKEVQAAVNSAKVLAQLQAERDAAKVTLDSAKTALDDVSAAKATVDDLLTQADDISTSVGTANTSNIQVADLVEKAQDAARDASDTIKDAIDAIEAPVGNTQAAIEAAYTALTDASYGETSAIEKITECKNYIDSIYSICQTAYDEAEANYAKLSAECDGALSAGVVDTTTANYAMNYALGAVKAADPPPNGVQLGVYDTNDDPVNLSDDDVNQIWALGETGVYRGVPGVDYFTIRYTNSDDEVIKYYYVVAEAGPRSYSDPIILTREFGLAQESVIGGFYNVPEDNTEILDSGYVYLDDTGHLRLLDYSLLRSGTLAYQLGEDFTTPAGLDAESVQDYLNEYVNQRIAFPNYNHSQTAENPNVIEITIDLTESDDASEINLFDIDSRFNTSVYLHITGTANSNTVINISDCAKIRIDSNIGGTPIINLYRSNLYYDASIINYLKTPQVRPLDNTSITPIVSDMRLWYERFYEDYPNLIVDNMTVREVDGPVVSEEVDTWTYETSNDNHYLYALRSLSFSSDANIIGCELYVKNGTTANIDVLGKSIISSSFRLPQGSGLVYPEAALVKALTVSGTFVTTYYKGVQNGQDTFAVMITNFTAVSQVYDIYNSKTTGTISFLTECDEVTNVAGVNMEDVKNYGTEIPGWGRSFHIFSGGVLG